MQVWRFIWVEFVGIERKSIKTNILKMISQIIKIRQNEEFSHPRIIFKKFCTSETKSRKYSTPTFDLFVNFKIGTEKMLKYLKFAMKWNFIKIFRKDLETERRGNKEERRQKEREKRKAGRKMRKGASGEKEDEKINKRIKNNGRERERKRK